MSDAGKVFSVGYDKSICLFDSERPRETLVRFEGCHAGAVCSVAFDADNNWLITGSYDGVVKIWSQEGRFLDSFEGLSDQGCVLRARNAALLDDGQRPPHHGL